MAGKRFRMTHNRRMGSFPSAWQDRRGSTARKRGEKQRWKIQIEKNVKCKRESEREPGGELLIIYI